MDDFEFKLDVPDLPPRDVVQPTGLTLESLDAMQRTVGVGATWHEPGAIVSGPDGTAVGIEPPTSENVLVVAPCLSARQVDEVLARHGMTRDDRDRRWPDLRFIEMTGAKA